MNHASVEPVQGGHLSQLLNELAPGAAEHIELPGGVAVYEAGAPARRLFFIRAGQVRTYQGSEASARLLEILGADDWFGEAALAGAPAYASTAVTASPTTLDAIAADALMDAASRRPQAAAELIRQLAGKLQSAREDGNRLVFDDCSVRLVKTLLRFSGTAAATPQEGGAVMLHITHRQLAQAVGAARETVSLALTQLRHRNLLRTGRNRLTFHPEALRGLAPAVREKSGAGSGGAAQECASN